MGNNGFFNKVLIANRGEIAVRIIRSCRELGIKTVSVFSDCDRSSPHVRWANEAYYLGESVATKSYLNGERILEIAKAAGADALHPGYGFLSEKVDFADACRNSGIHFIGPTGKAMQLAGDKIKSREVAQKLGIPVIPGYDRPLAHVREAKRIARKLGYPVLIKAAAGGGGKGLQVAHQKEQIESAFRVAQSEAEQSFKDPTLFIEKYLEQPHHIEIQIFGDHHGNVVTLGERECSVQRRHQKIIEESPSPFITEKTRNSLLDASIRIAKEIGYQNSGTIEFLVDGEQNFYFLEMNARLQVEHPVTETIHGLDLVRAQLKIAAGETLKNIFNGNIQPRGHSIECRIYAEDPSQNFFPCPGKVSRLESPDGPGIRIDSSIYPGAEIPIFYDSLIAKLIAWGEDRREAMERIGRALEEYEIDGIKTNLAFLKFIMARDEFIRGCYDTGLVSKYGDGFTLKTQKEYEELAAIAAFIVNETQKGALKKCAIPPQNNINPWRMAGRRNFNTW